MKERIDSAIQRGKIPKETKDQHKGFSEWGPHITKHDHQSIVQVILLSVNLFHHISLFTSIKYFSHICFPALPQILIDGRDTNSVDNDGHRLPTLVYMAREKRPQWRHNFKAGAMNALVSFQFSQKST